MAKPNYRQVKKQKEFARKARQQEKLTRKQTRVTEGEPEKVADAPVEPAAPVDKVMP